MLVKSRISIYVEEQRLLVESDISIRGRTVILVNCICVYERRLIQLLKEGRLLVKSNIYMLGVIAI
jgi:hypothetical protein